MNSAIIRHGEPDVVSSGPGSYQYLPGPNEQVQVAKMLSKYLGVQIEFVHGKDPVATPGKVAMQLKQFKSLLEWQAANGLTIHECSHIALGSVDRKAAMVDKVIEERVVASSEDPDDLVAHRRDLAEAAVNVAFDIADELAIERILSDAYTSTRIHNLLASLRLREELMSDKGGKKYANQEEAREHLHEKFTPWKVGLVHAYLVARTVGSNAPNGHHYPRWMGQQAIQNNIDCIEDPGGELVPIEGLVSSVGSAASRLSQRIHRRNYLAPDRKWGWRRDDEANDEVFEAADSIMEKLLAIAPDPPPPKPEGEDDDEGDGEGAGDGDGGGSGGNEGPPTAEELLEQLRRDSGEAADAMAKKYGLGCGVSDRSLVPLASPGQFNVRYYKEIRMSFPSAVDELVTTDKSMELTMLEDTGAKLSDNWPGIYTDGRVFLTPRIDEGKDANVAILVDISGSMCGDRLCDASAAAKAIGESFQDAGFPVRAWRFSSGSEEIFVGDLDKLSSCGGTEGLVALDEATQWLKTTLTGRRLCIIMTDGAWSDRTHALATCKSGQEEGVEYVVCGIGFDGEYEAELRDHWPSAEVLCVDDRYPSLLVERMVEVAASLCV